MKHFIYILILLLPKVNFSQEVVEPPKEDVAVPMEYRATAEKQFDLVNTKLDVRFDFNNARMFGKEWLTVRPHFYESDSIVLDAKGMDISKVAMMKGSTMKDLVYSYDSTQLKIRLDRPYKRNESLILYFVYTSKPNEVKSEGSAAITDAKGLYFINPKGDIKNKPTQIWTQGETESNSVWMITIDKPNQKSTQELYMTVPSKFVTLSNGLLLDKKQNTDGTRTDHWKMDLPHAPYLFFMGVGDFAVIKDSYKGKEVSYYVEKEYAPYAKGIFGLTPEMIKCFAQITGVEYPWPKYAQIVGRDFVSGAMENTTATLHQESAYQNNRQLIDGNEWESTIAHELFHHWFGDLVTTESWSNITLNESFANYSEYLWYEYKYGKDKADEHNLEDMNQYLASGSENKDLVRYYYKNREEVFDQVSYPKGGRILHMLRNYLGDSAFFKGLNLYLTQNKFKSAEVSQLRMAFEEVSGKDLNWYFNQWYFGSGHPKLKINYQYNDQNGIAKVIIDQNQTTDKIFKLPIYIDIYESGIRTRHQVWTSTKSDTFQFNYTARPELINVDAEKIILADKTDNKNADNYKAQWKYARNYMDRFESIQYFAKKNMPELVWGLKDRFEGLQLLTIQKIGSSSLKRDKDVLTTLDSMSKTKIGGKVRAAAINILAKTGDKKYQSIYEANVNDSSYHVAGASLKGLNDIDPEKGYELAKKYGKGSRGALGKICSEIMIKKGTEEDFDIISGYFNDLPANEEKFGMLNSFKTYIMKLKDDGRIQTSVDMIINFRNQIPNQYREYVDAMFEQALKEIGKSKSASIQQYIDDQLK